MATAAPASMTAASTDRAGRWRRAARSWAPFLTWIPGYERASLRGDVQAGLTTAVMLIPQGMAYAMLAGLPPIVGLYASTVPLVLYALFGTSRQLAVGPVAMVSLLVASGVAPLAEVGSAQYVGYAVTLAMLVGVLQTLMGVFRAGFLVNFLSHPVVSGFTSAAALIIGLSQLKHLLGVSIPRSHLVHTIVLGAFGQMSAWHWLTMAIGGFGVATLLLIKRYRPQWPGALIVVALSTLAVRLFDLGAAGVQVVGDVPAGLPGLSLPGLDTQTLGQLMPTALTIALVGFMESISVARHFARRNRYEVVPNQELIGLGLANVFGSLFGAYPTTGGFSRTAVNAQAGAKTGLAAIITATVVAITLLFFTPVFHDLPKATLAAIIMVAVFGLIDVAEVRHLWQVKRADLTLLGLTFAATLSLGIEEGIMAGVGASLLGFVVRSTRPHTAELGRLPGTTAWRNLERFPEATSVDGLLVVRIDAQFYFGNVSFLKETLGRLEAAAAAPVKAVVIDASSVNQLDSSADAALHALAEDYAERGVAFALANVKGPVRDVMRRSGLWARLGGDDGDGGRIFLSVDDAARSLCHEARAATSRDHAVAAGSDCSSDPGDYPVAAPAAASAAAAVPRRAPRAGRAASVDIGLPAAI